ncbi:MAG: amidohydrolase family protein, partial [Thermodesulfobacteriota bacterium]
MLLRTSDKTRDDEAYDGGLPIPTQIVSNSEFYPIPQSERQRRIELLIRSMADERAAALGWSRRRFLQSACGTATALMALNIASGCSDATSDGGFQVNDCATRDPDAARELFQAPYFIVDVQTHHADLEGPIGTNPALQEFFADFRICAPATIESGDCHPGQLVELSRANYLKEVFLDSETAIAMMSGIPAPNQTLQLISNEAMAATKDLGNQIGASQRMLTQGMLTPNFPESADTGTRVQDMEHLVRDLDIKALKTYTGAGYGVFGPDIAPWWLDDESVAYPMYEEALRLGIDIVNCHKGLRLGIFDPEHIHPRDIPKAARDWPQIRFGIYHSGFEFLDELCRLKTEEIPEATNVYPELGAIFASRVLSDEGVDAIGHLLGKLVTAFGADHILWGTDSIWYGTPQWQIDALKTFRMPPRLMEEFGYPEITDEMKAQIFGLNASRLYGIDPDEVRCTLPEDQIAQAQRAYAELREPSLRTYGPKTRRDFLKLAFNGRP